MRDFFTVISGYGSTFGERPIVVAEAPGRVNLIGEHTDYNEGFVLPLAIEATVQVAAGPGQGNLVRVHSEAMRQTAEFPTQVWERSEELPWQNYVRGVVAELRNEGVALGAANLWIGGDLPAGAGLGSSAALCVATALALIRLAGTELHSLAIAEMAQRAEREFAGTPCGIMDPYASVFGKPGHAILLDCRYKTHEYVPLVLPSAELLVVSSGVKHELSGSAYAQRVQECQAAVAFLRSVKSEIRSLRDVTEEMLAEVASRIDPVVAKRAHHVVTENGRVTEAVAALLSGRVEVLGQLLNASHDSLRDNYDASCPRIDELTAVMRADDSVLGARMVGGGFGGAILALANKGASTLRSHHLLASDCGGEIQVVVPAGGAFSRSLDTGTR